MTTQPEATTPRPTTLVGSAVEALIAQFYEPLDAATLFTDAWEGATTALKAPGPGRQPALAGDDDYPGMAPSRQGSRPSAGSG